MGVITENRSNMPVVTEKDVEEDIKELDENIDENLESGEEMIDSDGSDQSPEEVAPIPEETVDGWADAMSRVLAKTGPKNAKTMILAKESLPELDPELKKQRLEKRKKLRKKRAWEDLNYAKPDPLQKQYERGLQKVATRGVVQLFNAVKKHQTDMEEELEKAKTESKKERLYKNIDKKKFLQMLSGDSKMETHDDSEDKDTLEEVEKEEPAWKVLRDDFILGDNMTDWDKREDGNTTEKKIKKKEITKTKQRPQKKLKKS